MEIKIKQLDAGAWPFLVLPIIMFESFYKEPRIIFVIRKSN